VFTVSVAVEPLIEVLINATPPEVGEKVALFIDVAEPFTVTVTFCGFTGPLEVAKKVTELGVATTPLPPPTTMDSVTGTLTEPKTVFKVRVPVYTPAPTFVLVTERVAVDPLNVVLRKANPDVGVKLIKVIA